MENKRKPNILFVFSDQHRKHSLACYDNDQVISPNFDRFANFLAGRTVFST